MNTKRFCISFFMFFIWFWLINPSSCSTITNSTLQVPTKNSTQIATRTKPTLSPSKVNSTPTLLDSETKPKPRSRPTEKTISQPPTEVFSISSSVQIPPQDILEETNFIIGGGPGDLCVYSSSTPTVYLYVLVEGDHYLFRGSSCGWQPNELVQIVIRYPDEREIVRTEPTKYENTEFEKSAGIYFDFILKPDDPLGIYTFALTGKNGAIQSSVETPKTPHTLYLKDHQISLRNFASKEHIRVFAYRDIGDRKYTFMAWQEYNVDSNGQLLLQLTYDTPEQPIIIIDGDVSGELLPYHIESIIRKPSSPTSSTNDSSISPQINNFKACFEPCIYDKEKALKTFPENTKNIYIYWNYTNIPIGANYTRSWTMDGKDWVRYKCIWSGPETGLEALSLREPGGLHSGLWEIKITVNNQILLREQIEVEGNWTYWSPAGVKDTCYGN